METPQEKANRTGEVQVVFDCKASGGKLLLNQTCAKKNFTERSYYSYIRYVHPKERR